MYLTKKEINSLLNKEEDGLIIRPLLDQSQINEVSVDFRLGTDFLLSFLGREISVDVTNSGNGRPIQSFFSETRRLIGEEFVFHPHQTVLCSTLEYIKLPSDVMLSLTTRSSYSRLGFNLSTMVQPGYCGCISIELTNTGNTPVKLLVGARILQARFFRLQDATDYFSQPTSRKYICQVRPQISKANEDMDLEILKKMIHG